MSLEKRVKELFAILLRESPELITDKTRPANLARWDSLQHLILVSGFEEEFDLDIDPEEVVEMYENFRSFKKIIIDKIESLR